MKIVSNHPSINAEEILSLEKDNNLKFPPDFVNFYLNHNGGDIDSSERNKFMLHGFVPLIAVDLNVISLYKDFLKQDRQLFFGLLPFAYDEGGHTFLISTKALDFDSIYLWYSSGSPQKIASSFIEILKALD